MHPNSTNDLVLEHLPSGELAWLRPDPAPAPKQSRQEWDAHQASLRQYVFDVQTRFVLAAPSESIARAWFTADADADIDCGPLLFGKPHLASVLPMDVQVPQRPQSALQRFAERFAAASRPCHVLARCRTCHDLQTAPDCPQREHWGV